MAQKTIYVRDENVHLYDRAEQLSGEPLAQLIPKLLAEYIEQAEQDLTIFAICTVYETADDVAWFNPVIFIKAPRGTTAREVKIEVSNMGYDNHYIIPLIDAHPEIVQMYERGEQDVVVLENYDTK